MESYRGYPKLGPNINGWTTSFTISKVLFTVQVVAYEYNSSIRYGVMVESDGHRKASVTEEFHFLFKLLDQELKTELVVGELKVDNLSRRIWSTEQKYPRTAPHYSCPFGGKIVCSPEEVEFIFIGRRN
jgi:hypothetical protein